MSIFCPSRRRRLAFVAAARGNAGNRPIIIGVHMKYFAVTSHDVRYADKVSAREHVIYEKL